MSSCRVRGCRFKTSHTTAAHKCGTCGQFGHGQLECANSVTRSRLSLFADERLENENCWCDKVLCPNPWTHTKNAHHCTTCGSRGDDCECPLHATRKCPSCNTFGEVNVKHKIFTGGDCLVCMDSKPMVVFSTCKHANVCVECVVRLE